MNPLRQEEIFRQPFYRFQKSEVEKLSLVKGEDSWYTIYGQDMQELFHCHVLGNCTRGMTAHSDRDDPVAKHHPQEMAVLALHPAEERDRAAREGAEDPACPAGLVSHEARREHRHDAQRNEQAAHEREPDHVDVELPAPLFGGHVLDPAADREARVGQRDVQPPVLGDDAAHRLPQLFVARHVTRVGVCLAAAGVMRFAGTPASPQNSSTKVRARIGTSSARSRSGGTWKGITFSR